MPKINSKSSLFLLLLIISTLTIIPYLGLTNFHTKGEPREAIVAVSMLQTDNWILPVNNGGDIAYKPPFFHWCIAALSLPTGEVTEFTSRLPSALAVIIMTAMCFLFFAIDPQLGPSIFYYFHRNYTASLPLVAIINWPR